MKVTLSFICLVATLNLAAQDDAWFSYGSRDTDVHFKPRYGYNGYYQEWKCRVFLKSGDTLTVYGQLWQPRYFLVTLADTSFSVVHIRYRKIKFIRAYVETLGKDSVDLIPLGNSVHPKKAFWRLIKRDGDITIYDRSVGVFSTDDNMHSRTMFANRFNTHMYLVTGDETVKIYGGIFWYPWEPLLANRIKKRVVKFINKRYNQSFKVGDFKKDMDMIDYIIDHEKERRNK